MLKGNEVLLKHESRVRGREAQHGSVGGKEGRASESVAKKRMMWKTGLYCEAQTVI